MRRTMIVVLAALALAALAALPALAAHESNNALDFAPVAGSSAPGASGGGVINYVKGTSGEEPDTVWTAAFRFQGLSANMEYTVGVKGRFADPTAFSPICSFTTNATGRGSCTAQFVGLRRLAIAQLRLRDTPVLQATRQGVASGPGTITSRGGCREPEQAGSTC